MNEDIENRPNMNSGEKWSEMDLLDRCGTRCGLLVKDALGPFPDAAMLGVDGRFRAEQGVRIHFPPAGSPLR